MRLANQNSDRYGGIVVASHFGTKRDMTMTALLSTSIRDSQGRLHKRDESLTIVNRLPRADFDTRPLLKVRFEDGSTGVVFSEEVQLSSAECVSGNEMDSVRSFAS